MENHLGFPWQIEVLPEGNTRVFGLTLGKTPLIEAEKQFREVAEITLFSNKGKMAIEAFFTEVKIGGLKSKMVLSIDLPADVMQQMMDRGARISTLGSGERKVTLSGDDVERVRYSPIASITYLPAVQLDDSIVEKRFGIPAEKLTDPTSDAIHWLYPETGVDVAISEKNKEVIQYVVPAKFDTLVRPLKTAIE